MRRGIPSAGLSQLDHLELRFSRATVGTDPALWDLLPEGPWRDPFLRKPFSLIIDESTHHALPSSHLGTPRLAIQVVVSRGRTLPLKWAKIVSKWGNRRSTGNTKVAAIGCLARWANTAEA